ncbi:unnamed protein product [Symbiodinium pilosum]|uniref:Uncharacterized protein n=1 Tax=Symbiodinium pilosum TaxID=2952 RepID=A0A812N2U6_SYMPI|nr:unnamed protein product [Symbiodinium pilosum]
MPHVFNHDKNEFEQIHSHLAGAVKKRQRVSESMKFLLAQEATLTKKEEARAKRKEAMKD